MFAFFRKRKRLPVNLRGREIITQRRRICLFSLPRLAGLLFCLLAFSLAAEDALFPSPLHLTRRITDPFSEQPVIVEEFCEGSRIVSVIGTVISIADYSGGGTLTRIDRQARTFSVSSFRDLTRSRPAEKMSASVAAQQPWKVISDGKGKLAGREVERVVIQRGIDGTEGGQQSIEIAVDPDILLSRGSVETLLGFSFPAAPRTEQAELIFGALSKSGSAALPARKMVGLPVAQIERFSFDGENLESRSEVIRVGTETIDPGLVEIPAGSMRIELEELEVWRKLQEADQPPRP